MRFNKSRALKLYLDGFCDKDIAHETDVDANCVSKWRNGLYLPRNCRVREKPSESTEKDLDRLYTLNLSDRAIAKNTDLTKDDVKNWRISTGKKRKHAEKTKSRNYTIAAIFDEKLAMELYNMGFPDIYIASATHTSVGYVGTWRNEKKLRANGRIRRGTQIESFVDSFKDDDPESLLNDDYFINNLCNVKADEEKS